MQLLSSTEVKLNIAIAGVGILTQDDPRCLPLRVAKLNQNPSMNKGARSAPLLLAATRHRHSGRLEEFVLCSVSGIVSRARMKVLQGLPGRWGLGLWWRLV